jgi:hypothetical protein
LEVLEKIEVFRIHTLCRASFSFRANKSTPRHISSSDPKLHFKNHEKTHSSIGKPEKTLINQQKHKISLFIFQAHSFISFSLSGHVNALAKAIKSEFLLFSNVRFSFNFSQLNGIPKQKKNEEKYCAQ